MIQFPAITLQEQVLPAAAAPVTAMPVIKWVAAGVPADAAIVAMHLPAVAIMEEGAEGDRLRATDLPPAAAVDDRAGHLQVTDPPVATLPPVEGEVGDKEDLLVDMDLPAAMHLPVPPEFPVQADVVTEAVMEAVAAVQ